MLLDQKYNIVTTECDFSAICDFYNGNWEQKQVEGKTQQSSVDIAHITPPEEMDISDSWFFYVPMELPYIRQAPNTAA